MFKTAEQGAQTSIYCAVAEEMEGVSGKYLRDCHIVEESKGAQDDAAAKKLWEVSLQLVGLEKWTVKTAEVIVFQLRLLWSKEGIVAVIILLSE